MGSVAIVWMGWDVVIAKRKNGSERSTMNLIGGKSSGERHAHRTHMTAEDYFERCCGECHKFQFIALGQAGTRLHICRGPGGKQGQLTEWLDGNTCPDYQPINKG